MLNTSLSSASLSELSSPSTARTKINNDAYPAYTTSFLNKALMNAAISSAGSKTRKPLNLQDIRPITEPTPTPDSGFGISLKVANYNRNNSQASVNVSTSSVSKKTDLTTAETKRPSTAPTHKKVAFAFEGSSTSRKRRPNTTKSGQRTYVGQSNASASFVDYKRFVKPLGNENQLLRASSMGSFPPSSPCPPALSSGRMKALTVDIEVKMVETLDRLHGLSDNELVLRSKYKKVYSDTFEEIIKVCPFGKLLRIIKDAYDKDALIADQEEEKRYYDDLVVMHTNAQNNLAKMEKEFNQLQREHNQVKNELKRVKGDSQRYKAEIDRLTQLQQELSQGVKPEIRALLKNKDNKFGSSFRGPKSPMGKSFDSARYRLFSQDGMEAETKDLKDRDRLFELESELTKTILKEREITREISLINMEREKEHTEKKDEKTENNTESPRISEPPQRSVSRRSTVTEEDMENSLIDDANPKTESIREKLLRDARRQKLVENMDFDTVVTNKKTNHGIPPVLTSSVNNLIFRSDSVDSLSFDE